MGDASKCWIIIPIAISVHGGAGRMVAWGKGNWGFRVEYSYRREGVPADLG